MPRNYAGRSYQSAGRSTRRKTEWISGTTDFLDLTASEKKRNLSFSQAALVDLVPFTIIRTVGVIVIAADLNFITNQLFVGAFGGCIANDQARAIGVTALPGPFSEAGDDVWFQHQFFGMQIDDRADSDLVNSQTIVIDSKAQRKVEDGQAIQFLTEGGGEADGFDISTMLRILVKLH